MKAFRLPGHQSRSASFPGTFLHGKPVPNPGAWQVSLGPSFVHKKIHELGTKKHGLLCKKLPPLHQKWNDCILPSCHPDDSKKFYGPLFTRSRAFGYDVHDQRKGSSHVVVGWVWFLVFCGVLQMVLWIVVTVTGIRPDPTYIYIYLEPVCPLFWGLNPLKEGPFQSKQGSFGFYIYLDHPWLVSVFSNHGDRKSPKDRVVGPLPAISLGGYLEDHPSGCK